MVDNALLIAVGTYVTGGVLSVYNMMTRFGLPNLKSRFPYYKCGTTHVFSHGFGMELDFSENVQVHLLET